MLLSRLGHCLQASVAKVAAPKVLLLALHMTVFSLCAILPFWLILVYGKQVPVHS